MLWQLLVPEPTRSSHAHFRHRRSQTRSGKAGKRTRQPPAAKPAPVPKRGGPAAPLRAPALPAFARPDVPATNRLAAAPPLPGSIGLLIRLLTASGGALSRPQSGERSIRPPAACGAHPTATTAHPRGGPVPGPLESAALRVFRHDAHAHTGGQPKPKLSSLGPPKTPAAGGGQPMPAHIQEAIQNSLLVDLSAVRLHASTAAERKAQSLKARAFTFGNDIFLGHGEHPTDLTLITHEAAHVIQQQSVVQAQAWSTGSSDRFEREANQAAVAVGRGERFEVRERVDRPRVQRLGISDALDYFADKANNIPGYRMFTIVLGVNPINMQGVERSPANILRAVVELIPGGGPHHQGPRQIRRLRQGRQLGPGSDRFSRNHWRFDRQGDHGLSR